MSGENETVIPGLGFPTSHREWDKNVALATFDEERIILVSQDDKIGKCRLVTEFEKLGTLGSGAYGIVYKAKDTKSGKIVAMKKLLLEKDKEGLSVGCIREISILQKLKHQNIVNLKDVVVGKTLETIFLVMEYCEHDLAAVLDDMDTPLSEPQVKCIMKQLLNGLCYLHQNYVVHRDLKVSNLLLNEKGCLKIADFGLARSYGYPEKPMSPGVVTLWYRAPELLLMASSHTVAVDMWAAGCIFAELLLNKPLLPGKTEIQQMELIIDLLGTPNEQVWPGYSSLPIAENYDFKEQPLNRVNETFSLFPSAIGIMNSFLTYDPRKRIKAKAALNHGYFQSSPYPCTPDQLPFLKPQSTEEKTGSSWSTTE